MSWNFVVAGHNKDKIKANVRSWHRAPRYVQDAICAAIDELPDNTPFVVDSTGHIDANGGNAKFNVRTQHAIIDG